MKKTHHNRYNEHGRKSGHWVEECADGLVEEGQYVGVSHTAVGFRGVPKAIWRKVTL